MMTEAAAGQLISIDAEQAGKKLQVIRRYHSELLLIVFAAAIGFLYNAREQDRKSNDDRLQKLNTELQQYINVDRKTMIQQSFETTQILKEIKTVLIETQFNKRK